MVFEKEPPTKTIAGEMLKRVNDNTRRIRRLEERLVGVQTRLSSLEEKVIDEVEDLRKNFEQISQDIRAVSNTLSHIRSEMLKIDKSLGKMAKKVEVKELANLLEIYSPIKSKFTTREEVERLIEEKISEKVG